MKTTTAVFAAVLALASAAMAEDAVDREERTLETLGRLNGEALYCKRSELVRTIKEAIVRAVPTVREYGQTFEETTNTTYLDLASRSAPCSEPVHHKQATALAIEAMTQIFGEN